MPMRRKLCSPKTYVECHVPHFCVLTERYKSENFGDPPADKLGLSSGAKRDRSNVVSVGSAENLRQGYPPWGSYQDTANHKKSQPKKRLSFCNPFDPNKMYSEAPAFQHRWVHVFPINKKGVAFQTHHVTIQETKQDDSTHKSIENLSNTPQTSIKRKGILKRSPESIGPNMDNVASESASFKSESFGSSLKKSVMQSPGDPTPREENQVLLKRTWNQKDSPSLKRSPLLRRDKTTSEHNSSVSISFTSPESLRQRRKWNDSLLSGNTESFASVRRTGVDWTSLVEPAHLPITTDFYPAKETLNRDYVEYNTNLVVFKDDQGEGGEVNSEKK